MSYGKWKPKPIGPTVDMSLDLLTRIALAGEPPSVIAQTLIEHAKRQPGFSILSPIVKAAFVEGLAERLQLDRDTYEAVTSIARQKFVFG